MERVKKRRDETQIARTVELRRRLARGGHRWSLLASLGECVDREGWRVVVELGCWRDGQLRVRLKKYQPSGRFYFCEGITLSLDTWRALALMAKQRL